MTNIPKKLDINTFTPDEFVGKINELIDYLEANQTKEKSYKAASSVCCDSSFRLEGDTKEGTMYHVCNNCNKACDIKLTEKKVKASKGECFCSYYDWNRGTPNEKCMVHNPPEHDIDPETLCSKCGKWKGCHPIKECKTFVSPEHEIKSPDFDMDKFKKLAKEAKKTFKHEDEWVKLEKDYIDSFGEVFHTWSSYGWWIKYIRDNFVSKEKIKEYVSDKLNCYSNPDYRVALKDLSESLGLGD